MQHEYSVSSRLIDEQMTVTVCSKRDGDLTRRLSKWLSKNEKGWGCKGRKVERLGASSGLCRTN